LTRFSGGSDDQSLGGCQGAGDGINFCFFLDPSLALPCFFRFFGFTWFFFYVLVEASEPVSVEKKHRTINRNLYYRNSYFCAGTVRMGGEGALCGMFF